VAITVILAAVIGTFVLGLGQNVQSTPQASFDFDFDQGDQRVDITHNGGDTLEIGENTATVEITSTSGGTIEWAPTNESDDAVSAGDTQSYNYTENGTTVRVVWTGVNNESSATLGQQEAPA
jgi:FlaG/FlaF family flagellin (archaellin)